jgi:hypothetical protein
MQRFGARFGPKFGVSAQNIRYLQGYLRKGVQVLQASLHSASLPRNAESLIRCQGTGDPDCWGESHEVV